MLSRLSGRDRPMMVGSTGSSLRLRQRQLPDPPLHVQQGLADSLTLREADPQLLHKRC